MITNAIKQELETVAKSLECEFRDIKQVSTNRMQFTLKKKNSAMSHSGRMTGSACWHVHGKFFDCLFKLRKDIFITSRGSRTDINGGNWQDYNIGSQIHPLMASEACACGFDSDDSFQEFRHDQKLVYKNPYGIAQ